MNRKNSLIVGGLSVIVLVIGVFIIIPAIMDISTVISNSTTNHPTEKGFSFDNSTHEATAISIARLNEGTEGFGSDIITNASLTSDGKYWIVKMHQDGGDDWVVTIDAKTLMSKKNGGMDQTINTWRSLDELKAKYIAQMRQRGDKTGRPSKLTMNSKNIWKVPTYDFIANGWKLNGYVYVDVATGKSKVVDLKTGVEGWMTLKEVDDLIIKAENEPASFRDALRDLYPE